MMRIGTKHRAAATAAGAAHRVNRLDAPTTARWFPESQRRSWPHGYRPAIGVAHLLRPDGLPLRDFLQCYREVRAASYSVAQTGRECTPVGRSGVAASPDIIRDVATDYTLWMRCQLEDYLTRLQSGEGGCGGTRQARVFRRLTARDRVTVHDAEIRTLFDLTPYAAPCEAHDACRSPCQDTFRRNSSNDDVYRNCQAHVDRSHDTGGTAAASSIVGKNTTRECTSNKTRSSNNSENSCSRDSDGERVVCYSHTPYAVGQEYAMRLVTRAVAQATSNPALCAQSTRIFFATMPDIRNALYTDFDSMSALRALSLYSGDDITFSTELVQRVSLYLRRRLDELSQAEEAFTTAVPEWTFARDSPILSLFGTGRLAWLLNGSGGTTTATAGGSEVRSSNKSSYMSRSSLLPCPVYPVQTPSQARQRARQSQRLLRLKENSLVGNRALFADGFTMPFPCEVLSVHAALRKYRPAIVLVEPHVDRDWLSDIRGFYSVREVLVLGPVDSPAMASFSYPFLSFGVTPGPQSYWLYSDCAQIMRHAAQMCMPVDAPHVMQGYDRRFVDSISAYLISPNDCAVMPSQYRCLAFVRQRPPQRRARETTSA